MKLRCEVAIPSGHRQGRVLIRLGVPDPGVLEILPAHSAGEATHQIIDVCGAPLITFLPELDPIVSGEMMRAGYWEFPESMALLSLARPGMTFVDAGANLGYYSALLARALQSEGQIYAFEPEPRNALVATANVLLARLLFPQAAPAQVFPCALTESVGEARLNVYERNLGMHSLVYGSREAAGSSAVPTNTLDTLRDSGGPAAPLRRRIDLLKADVQGSELALLRGAERTLARDRPVLCLECEPYLSGTEACVALVRWLADHHYTRFRVFHSNRHNPHEALVEFARVLTAEEVLDYLQRQLIGPYGSLLAFPDGRDKPERSGTKIARTIQGEPGRLRARGEPLGTNS
jgi:FkbM family methyltransferase